MTELDLIAKFIIVLILSASVHEMLHAYVAYKLGDDLAHSHGRLSLNPFVHIDPFLTIGLPLVLLLLGQPPILAAKPVPINTSRIKGEELGFAAVAIAGPLSNLVIAAVFGVFIRVLQPTGLGLEFAELFVLINVGLFVFNMMPWPPLDGSRVLYAVAPEPLQRIMRQIESFGIMGLVVFLLIAGPFIAPVLQSVNESILEFLVL